MNKFSLTLLPLLLLSLSLPARADLLASGFNAEFEIRVSGIYVGITKRQISKQQDRLEYVSFSEPKGVAEWLLSDVIRETTTMEYHNGQVKPILYTYQQSGGKDEVNETVRFDWKKKELIISMGDKHYPLKPQSYDVLSFQLAMMKFLKDGKKQFVINVADHHDYYTYHAKVIGEALIQTPYKSEMNTILVESTNKKDGSLFRFWCYPELEYMPVRVEYVRSDNGITSMLELKSFSTKNQ